MSKVVYNACFGGFGLSALAQRRYKELSGKSECEEYKLDRHDPILVKVVEELGEKASCDYANLKIKELASGTPYWIDEYDGNETVATPDGYNWIIAP